MHYNNRNGRVSQQDIKEQPEPIFFQSEDHLHTKKYTRKSLRRRFRGSSATHWNIQFGWSTTRNQKLFETIKTISSLSREKRQLLVVAVVGIKTSLTTLFTTKELYSMSTASEDSLIDDTNHIISVITYQETKIERMDAQQHQLNNILIS